MTTKELKQLIKTLRSLGVVSYKHEGLELLLDPNHSPATGKRKKPKETLQETIDKTAPQLTDEEWLLATAGSFDSIEEQAN